MTLGDRIVRMAERRDADVTPACGELHALCALLPGLTEGSTWYDELSDEAFEQVRQKAIAHARKALREAGAGSLAESAAAYALRLLDAP